MRTRFLAQRLPHEYLTFSQSLNTKQCEEGQGGAPEAKGDADERRSSDAKVSGTGKRDEDHFAHEEPPREDNFTQEDQNQTIYHGLFAQQ